MNKDDIPEDLPPDSDHRTFETEYTGRPPSIAIVEAIATIEGIESPDVGFTLYESIDPEALDELFDDCETEEKTENGTVAEFHVENYAVIINADGTLTIKAPEETV